MYLYLCIIHFLKVGDVWGPDVYSFLSYSRAWPWLSEDKLIPIHHIQPVLGLYFCYFFVLIASFNVSFFCYTSLALITRIMLFQFLLTFNSFHNNHQMLCLNNYFVNFSIPLFLFSFFPISVLANLPGNESQFITSTRCRPNKLKPSVNQCLHRP